MRTCPFCSTENEAFFRFCLGCGADLDEALGGEPEPPPPAPGAGEMKGDGAPRAADRRVGGASAAPNIGLPGIAGSSSAPSIGQPVIAGPSAEANIGQPGLARPTAEANIGQPGFARPSAEANIGQPGVAGPSTAPKPARQIAQTKDTAVDLPAVSAVAVATKAAVAKAGSSTPEAPTPGPRPAADRMKTLDPGGAVKPGSAAAQAVAQALVDPARIPDEPENGPATNPRPITGAGARAGAGAAKVAEVATKRAGTPPGPELTPPASKKGGEAKAKARLVIILEDGTDGAVLDLSPDVTVIGREGVEISFPHDDFLARRHAEFYFQNGLLHLKPLESTNGVFLQVHQEVELENNDIFRIGQQLLSFEVLAEVAGALEPEPKGQAIPLGSPVPEGAWGRLGQLIAPETMGSVYLLGGTEVYLGRERGDITFPGDGFVSGLHAQISMRNGRCYLKDLGSSNGTYIRLSKPTLVKRGMLVLAGQQLFRVEQ